MRETLSLIVAVGGLAAAAACGGNDETAGDFCSQYAAFDERAEDIAANMSTRDPDDEADRAAIADDYDRFVEEMRAVDPPAEIAESWNQSIDVSSALADAIRDNDEQAAAQAMDDASNWETDLETYVTQECGGE